MRRTFEQSPRCKEHLEPRPGEAKGEEGDETDDEGECELGLEPVWGLILFCGGQRGGHGQ